jgi:hypothetical protein
MIKYFFQFFDKKQKMINEVIQKDINEMGNFELLKFPIESLNKKIKVIQFFKKTNFGTVSGLGSDEMIENAYLKAIVEYYERLAFFKSQYQFNLSSTNGIAAHRIKSIAIKSSQEEALERDSFLRHWYTNTPFKPISLKKHEQNLNEELMLISCEIKLAETYLGHTKTIVCFLILKDTKGFAIGLSSGKGNKDREKAIHEALINYFFGHLGITPEKQVDKIKKNGMETLQDHRAFWLYMNELPPWTFENGFKITSLTQSLNRKKFQIRELDRFPFWVIHSEHEDLIPLRVGDICKFYHLGLNQNKINVVLGSTQYHPIP